MNATITGWLLDLYPDAQNGLVIWLLEEQPVVGGDGQDGEPAAGRRMRLRQEFPVTFYVAGPNERLRALWAYLKEQEVSLALSRTQRRDLFQADPLTVMAIQVQQPARLPGLFFRASAAFPDLDYYDADVAISLRHAAVFGAFPLAKVRVTVNEKGWIENIDVLDSSWEIDHLPVPLRIMRIEPDCDPRHASPHSLHIQAGRRRYQFPLEPARPLLVNLAALLQRFDPDLLLTAWGDTWLLPLLLELSKKLALPLPLNRDESQEIIHRPERSYQAYGQVIYRGRQVQLFGRWHIDIFNAMMFHDYGLDGILESARVTGLPAQQAARLSPGTGISAMQMVTALRQGVLIPWHKQQAESSKSALDLLNADQGGLVYQPLVGLHRDVAEIDFISMYPSIMAYFNVSPETVGDPNQKSVVSDARFERVPELNLWVNRETHGLIPQTLKPLLEKRVALKEQIALLPAWDPRRELYKGRASAHKWLLVTCFGYLGYKNARFGRIEAHQAVTAYSRECLLRAKEVAEEAGYAVLHMYVDGMWVKKPGRKTETDLLHPPDIQPLLEEIAARTHLPIALEGIYRWVAFLPSRVNARVPVANRYFGVFQDGSLKVRGIEARRRDTPPFIAQTQMTMLERLSAAPSANGLPGLLPEMITFLRQRLRLLRTRRVPLQDLIVTQRLSRELDLYRSPSPAAQAALQLQAIGKSVRPGQPIKLLYTLGEPGVHAWDCPPPPTPAHLDVAYYVKLFLRAADSVLQPLGLSPSALQDWLFNDAHYLAPIGRLPLLPVKPKYIKSIGIPWWVHRVPSDAIRQDSFLLPQPDKTKPVSLTV